MPFADVNPVSFPILIPSLAANQNVSLTPTAREVSFVKVKDVLRNQTLVILLLVVLEPFVP